MVELFSGTQGSGKTYRSVHHLYHSFCDPKFEFYGNYNRFYTNINEFNFDFFNNFDSSLSHKIKGFSLFSIFKKQVVKEVSFDSPVGYQLDFDELLIHLEELRTLFLNKVPDTKILERAEELKLVNTLFVIDEAYNFFDEKNVILVWWLYYHRHLHQDIFLITPDFSSLYRRYLKAEFFYEAVPASLRLRKNYLSYNRYKKYQLFKNSYIDSIHLKFDPIVHSLYVSGANSQPQKVVHKFILIAVVLALLVTLAFYVFSKVLGSRYDDENATQSSSKSQIASSPSFSPIDRTSSFTVVCIGFECSCMGQNFMMNNFNQYITSYSLQPVETTMASDGILLRTFARNDKFFKEVLNVSIDPTATH